MIADFLNSKSSKAKEFRVYNITEFDTSNDKYYFSILRETKIFPSLSDTINGVAKTYFPTKFVEKNNRLFLWGYADKNNLISSELVKKLQNYDIVDSLFYNVKEGTIPKNSEEIILTDDNQEATNYFVCKSDITHYAKIINNKVIKSRNYPELNCD